MSANGSATRDMSYQLGYTGIVQRRVSNSSRRSGAGPVRPVDCVATFCGFILTGPETLAATKR